MRFDERPSNCAAMPSVSGRAYAARSVRLRRRSAIAASATNAARGVRLRRSIAEAATTTVMGSTSARAIASTTAANTSAAATASGAPSIASEIS